MHEEVRDRNRDVVRDEEMRNGKESTHDKLRDLKRRESALDGLRDTNPKRTEGVVCILRAL